MPDDEAAGHSKSKIANLKYWWKWWRNLSSNPIYLRERGQWGRPNPFYERVNRFSPLLVLAALVLGSCTLYSNPALLLGGSDFGPLFCLFCLPGIVVSALTLFGSFMAPAVTAPSISSELSQGTWDILRLTPQSTLSILLAKLFGGLSRLPIWTVLGALTLVQTCFLMFGLAALLPGDSIVDFFLIILTSVCLLGRPWIEILFAAFLGMYVSTWIRSQTLALATSYGALIFMKVIVWVVAIFLPLLLVLDLREGLLLGVTSSLPVILYGLATAGLLFGLFHRAQKLS
jgi:ABC-type transport system involved in multi-copper enzyme maturation permease subunit